ncbi:hypothetical protein [Tsukamurella sp. 1534]|uniref:hypothetical protein n=1 Tax=Tsukamurella sp. 1534 TaxID=1151061 RepID=UPI00059305E3|nr:hypothetical protein [Tsukamurella sp. 1534]
MNTTVDAAAVSPARIARFTAVMYKPHYVLYGVLWVLALEGTAAVVTGGEWAPGAATAVRAAVVVIVLLYLRMVDEQKDLDYDRVHNPDRPLVTGAVTAADLRAAMAIIAVVAVGASAALSAGSALAIAAVLLYGLLLWLLEARWPPMGGSVVLNLVITYPVQLLVTAYVLVSAMDTGEVPRAAGAAWTAAIFAGAFLQFEFARKTSRGPHPGEAYYSSELGVRASAIAGLGFAALAAVAAVLLIRPWNLHGAAAVLGWSPVVLLALPVSGAVRFARSGEDEYPIAPALLFVLALYTALLGVALTAGP